MNSNKINARCLLNINANIKAMISINPIIRIDPLMAVIIIIITTNTIGRLVRSAVLMNPPTRSCSQECLIRSIPIWCVVFDASTQCNIRLFFHFFFFFVSNRQLSDALKAYAPVTFLNYLGEGRARVTFDDERGAAAVMAATTNGELTIVEGVSIGLRYTAHVTTKRRNVSHSSGDDWICSGVGTGAR